MISANGDVLTPYIIFQGAVYLERWYRVDGVPEAYRIAVAPKGYVTDQIAIDWLKHFLFCTRDRTKKGEKRLLIYDGHGAHLTFEFSRFANQKIFSLSVLYLIQPISPSYLMVSHFWRISTIFVREIP
jgi:hypothetical protein